MWLKNLSYLIRILTLLYTPHPFSIILFLIFNIRILNRSLVVVTNYPIVWVQFYSSENII